MDKNQISANTIRLFLSCFLAQGIILLGVLFLAFLTDGNKLSEEMLGYGITLDVLIASVSGSAHFLQGRRRVDRGLVFGAFLWASLLAIAALLFEGTFQGVWVTLVLILAGSMLPVLLGKDKSRHRFTKKISTPHR